MTWKIGELRMRHANDPAPLGQIVDVMKTNTYMRFNEYKTT